MLRIFVIGSVIFCSIAILYTAYVAIRMRSLIAISSELVANSRPFQQVNPTASLKILILGDSTAVGTGVTDPRGSIAGRFGQDYPQAEVLNLGVNGQRVAGLVAGFPHYPDKSFDLVVLQIGANDIIRGTSVAEFDRDLSAAFDWANKVGKHVVALHSGDIGLAPLFSSWPVHWYMTYRTNQIRPEYMRIAAEKGVTYVNLYKTAAADPFLTDIPKYYAADLLHLTEAGYGVWYNDIRAAMNEARIPLP